MPPPYFKYTTFLSNIDEITYVNNDLFNFKKWITSSLDGSPYNSAKLFPDNYIDVSENFELFKIDTNNNIASTLDQYLGYLINNKDNNINLDSDFRYSLIPTSDKVKLNERINENISNNNEYFILYILKDGSNSLLKFDVNNELIEKNLNINIMYDLLKNLNVNNLFILNNKKILEYEVFNDLIDINDNIGLFNFRDSNSPFNDELIQYQEYINGENNVFSFAGYVNGFSFSKEYYDEIKNKLLEIFIPEINETIFIDIMIDNGSNNNYAYSNIGCIMYNINNEISILFFVSTEDILFEELNLDLQNASENTINKLYQVYIESLFGGEGGFGGEGEGENMVIPNFRFEYLIMYSKSENYSPNFKYPFSSEGKGRLINNLPNINKLYNNIMESDYNDDSRSISITLTESGEGSDFTKDYTFTELMNILDQVIIIESGEGSDDESVLINGDIQSIEESINDVPLLTDAKFQEVSHINYQNYIDANRIAIDNSDLNPIEKKFFVIIDMIDYKSNNEIKSNMRVRYVKLKSNYDIDITYKNEFSEYSGLIKDNIQNIQNTTDLLKNFYQQDYDQNYQLDNGDKKIGAIIVNYSVLLLEGIYNNIDQKINDGDIDNNIILPGCKIS